MDFLKNVLYEIPQVECADFDTIEDLNEYLLRYSIMRTNIITIEKRPNDGWNLYYIFSYKSMN